MCGLRHLKKKRGADHFAGLDVSVKETSVCIVDDTGRIVREVKLASEPQAALLVLKNSLSPQAARIGKPNRCRNSFAVVLPKQACPLVCVETRHMRAVANARINKVDRNDARAASRRW